MLSVSWSPPDSFSLPSLPLLTLSPLLFRLPFVTFLPHMLHCVAYDQLISFLLCELFLPNKPKRSFDSYTLLIVVLFILFVPSLDLSHSLSLSLSLSYSLSLSLTLSLPHSLPCPHTALSNMHKVTHKNIQIYLQQHKQTRKERVSLHLSSSFSSLSLSSSSSSSSELCLGSKAWTA